MSMRRLLCMSLALTASLAAAAEERTAAPSADCLDARAVTEVRHLDAQQLLVQTEQGRYALNLADRCAPRPEVQASLLSPQGWVCGGRAEAEFVRIESQLCAIDSIEPITAKAYAAETRRADGAHDAALLAAVEVQAKAPDRSKFLRSTAYCFDPRWVRSWSSDAKGIVVDTSPLRSGGNRYYRLELGQSCPELTFSQAVSFHSGVGGAICGNPGDIAKPLRGIPAGAEQGGVVGARFTAAGCPITAVYPVNSPSES